MPDYPVNHGGHNNGGFASFVRAAEAGILWPWDWTPECCWQVRIDYTDLVGPAATQRTTITIPSSGFTSGRLAVTFSGGPLSSPVVVTADASVAQDQDDLGDALETAITTAIGTTLAGVVASVNNDASAAAVVATFVAGIGRVAVAVEFTPAQRTTVTWGGTLVDGEYSVRIQCDDPNADEVVDNDRVGGTPANASAMAAAFETAAEALIATTLAGVLVSADDSGAVNTLIFEPGVEATVTASVTNNTTHTFGGTATDGDYVTRFDHASLPGGSLTVTTNRAGGSPATNTDLADAFEADVEARALLFPYLDNADNTAGANTLTFHAGVTGMNVVAVSAPAPGTLVVSDPTVVVADATPAGPTVTVSHAVVLALNSLTHRFPHHVMRDVVALEVTTAFGANRTITVGQGDGEATLLGGTPVTLNSTGRTLALATDTHYRTRYQGSMVPTATIVLGASATVTQGTAFVQIDYYPHPSMTASAA